MVKSYQPCLGTTKTCEILGLKVINRPKMHQFFSATLVKYRQQTIRYSTVQNIFCLKKEIIENNRHNFTQKNTKLLPKIYTQLYKCLSLETNGLKHVKMYRHKTKFDSRSDSLILFPLTYHCFSSINPKYFTH